MATLYPNTPRSPPRKLCDTFYDSEFPHVKSNLHNPALKSTKQDMLQICDRAIWKRPSEIFPTADFSLFTHISPKAVFQGYLADCYFLSSVCSLAKNPERIQRLFEGSHSNGRYAIYGYINGVKKEIVVDDYLIFDPLTNQLPFSKPCMNQLWVQLLEKAWAKVNGSYTNLEFGEEIEALEFLTGAPVDCYIHNALKITQEELWVKILETNAKGYVLTCSTKKEQSNESLRETGLMPFHVYSILDAKEILADPTEKVQRVLLLRDPWQKTSWKGGLQEEVKAEFKGLVDAECFVITFEEYMEHFKETTVCKYEDRYKHSIINIEGAEQALYLFEVKNRFNGYISLHQEHTRLYRLRDSTYKYSPVYLVLGKIESDRIKYVTSFVTSSLNTEHRQLQLSPGKYIVFTGADWGKLAPKSYTLHLYAEEQVCFQEARYDMRYLLAIMEDYAESNKHSWKKIAHGFYHFEKINFGFGLGVSFVKNTSSSQKIYYEEKMRSTGLSPLSSEFGMKGTLNAGEALVGIYKFTSTKGYSYGYNYKFIHM